ncbi:hypothetical protein CJ030_MR3G009486 [Morella rubra]|uniref:Transmembrane protein n=1 Tax=Morella rubra TaxID=262757 RepID=A0A6A1W3P1_9ROSI|nr:hypothetical protein CJ030_MR3G009486 [Morella rubra]
MEELGAAYRTGRFSSYERLVAIGLALLAVLSPLYIDRRPVSDSELEEEPDSSVSWLPLLLLVLILAISMSSYLDRYFARPDPYWIHRVGGSSCGIIVILLVLVLVLKCKASGKSWEA